MTLYHTVLCTFEISVYVTLFASVDIHSYSFYLILYFVELLSFAFMRYLLFATFQFYLVLLST